MMIRRIYIENIFSHARTEISFGEGLTAIVGPNGAGKSSIVESILLALFDSGGQTSAEVIRTRNNKRGIVRTGSNGAVIELDFEAMGRLFRVRREYDAQGNSRSHYLAEISGGRQRILARGVSEVTKYIVTNILGAGDPRIFTTTIFSRQDMLGQILEISASDRGSKILSLIGLEDLEKAREAIRDAANIADKRLVEIARDEERLRDLRTRLARERKDLERLKIEISDLDRRLSELEERRRELRLKIDIIRRFRDLSDRIKDLESLGGELERMRRDIVEIDRRLESYRGEGIDLGYVRGSIEKYQRASICMKRLEDVEEKIKRYREQIDAIRASMGREEAVAIMKILGVEAFEDPSDAIDLLRSSIENIRYRLSRIEGLVEIHMKALSMRPEDNRCPFCGQDLDPQNIKHIVEKHKEELQRLRDEMEEMKRLYEKALIIYQDLEKLSGRLREYVAKIDEASREAEDLKLCSGEANTICSEIFMKIQRIGLASNSGAGFKECGEILRSLERELGGLLERRRVYEERLREIMGIYKEQELRELRARAREIIAENPWLEELGDYAKAEKDLEDELRKIQSNIENLTMEAGSKRGELTRLDKIIAEREQEIRELEKRVSIRPSLERSLRVLRILEKNIFGRDGLLSQKLIGILISRLEEEVNRSLQIFSRSFRISIDRNFEISVRTNGGSLPGINSLSGGERTMLAIAFRIALAKILLGRLPGVMILDEPTQNLDAENKARLFEIIKAIAGVIRQVIIVTHDEEIIQKADRVIRVYNENGMSRVEV